MPALAPQGGREGVYRALLDRRDAQSVLLVGHQPGLGELASDIVWGSAAAPLDLRKGGACAIDLERLFPSPRGRLRWLVTCRVLLRLA